MATTYTTRAEPGPPAIRGAKRSLKFKVAWDTYATGGLDVSTEIDTLNGVDEVYFGQSGSASDPNFLPAYDGTNKKIMLYVASTGAQVANGVDVSGTKTVMNVIGH